MWKDRSSNEQVVLRTELGKQLSILIHCSLSFSTLGGFSACVVAAYFCIHVSNGDCDVSFGQRVQRALKLLIVVVFVLWFCLVCRGI